jgi:hypothetical protein
MKQAFSISTPTHREQSGLMGIIEIDFLLGKKQQTMSNVNSGYLH